jgi:hypothetical protein
MAIDAKMLADLKEKFGDLTKYKLSGYEVICRDPNDADFDKFQSELIDKTKRPYAMRGLFRACCVHPDVAAVDDMLTKKPGLAFTFGSKLAEKAGLGEAEEEKL